MTNKTTTPTYPTPLIKKRTKKKKALTIKSHQKAKTTRDCLQKIKNK